MLPVRGCPVPAVLGGDDVEGGMRRSRGRLEEEGEPRRNFPFMHPIVSDGFGFTITLL